LGEGLKQQQQRWGAFSAYPGLANKKLIEKDTLIFNEIKAFQAPNSSTDPELFKQRLQSLNAKDEVIKTALDFKLCSTLNDETQQNILLRQREGLVPKPPKAEGGKTI
jgi:hypothetical protein